MSAPRSDEWGNLTEVRPLATADKNENSLDPKIFAVPIHSVSIDWHLFSGEKFYDEEVSFI